MDDTSTSVGYSHPHMERKMSAMACTVFNELRLEGKLCDVVIKVNGFEFNAHKNILCSCSSYFRSVLELSRKRKQGQLLLFCLLHSSNYLKVGLALVKALELASIAYP